jgi:hypothetical protein
MTDIQTPDVHLPSIESLKEYLAIGDTRAIMVLDMLEAQFKSGYLQGMVAMQEKWLAETKAESDKLKKMMEDAKR